MSSVNVRLTDARAEGEGGYYEGLLSMLKDIAEQIRQDEDALPEIHKGAAVNNKFLNLMESIEEIGEEDAKLYDFITADEAHERWISDESE